MQCIVCGHAAGTPCVVSRVSIRATPERMWRHGARQLVAWCGMHPLTDGRSHPTVGRLSEPISPRQRLTALCCGASPTTSCTPHHPTASECRHVWGLCGYSCVANVTTATVVASVGVGCAWSANSHGVDKPTCWSRPVPTLDSIMAVPGMGLWSDDSAGLAAHTAALPGLPQVLVGAVSHYEKGNGTCATFSQQLVVVATNGTVVRRGATIPLLSCGVVQSINFQLFPGPGKAQVRVAVATPSWCATRGCACNWTFALPACFCVQPGNGLLRFRVHDAVFRGGHDVWRYRQGKHAVPARCLVVWRHEGDRVCVCPAELQLHCHGRNGAIRLRYQACGRFWRGGHLRQLLCQQLAVVHPFR